MTKVFCLVEERFVNPLFEVFDGGDLILSSYHDIEQPLAEMRVYLESPTQVSAAERAMSDALSIVGVEAVLQACDVPDEDWKFAYRRHFKTELVSPRILVQPEWARLAVIRLDPGMAFGTGKHETTKACLQYIDECAGDEPQSFLDMGTGSGILSIAACKLGYRPVKGFDVDRDAVAAARENAVRNGVESTFEHFALGRVHPGEKVASAERYDLVAANILGPLLIRFADEIVTYVGRRLIVSGILTELYAEVRQTYEVRGFREVSNRAIGEWTTGLLERIAPLGQM